MLMTSERWQNAIQNPKFITTENFVQNLSNAYHKHQQKNKEISKMAITEKWKKSLPQPQYLNGNRTALPPPFCKYQTKDLIEMFPIFPDVKIIHSM